MLLDLGAQLETELDQAEARLAAIRTALTQRRRQLLKPGAKLAINAGAALAGIALSPITFGWSLIATGVGICVTLWHAVEYGIEARTALALHKEARQLRVDVRLIRMQLEEIGALLELRYPGQL